MANAPFLLTLSLLLLCPFLFFFAPHILPQKQPPPITDLTDLALFRRASLAAAATSTKTPKIAFLFLTNSALHFAPLWQLFFKHSQSQFNIYIHSDPQSKSPIPGGVFSNRLIPAAPTRRGHSSLISAARRLLAAALLDDPANAYFALLSQHCVPLHSFNFIYQTLIPQFPIQSPIRRSFIEILDSEPQLWDRYVARGPTAMLPEVPFDRFRVGSQFFALTRRHAAVVVSDRKLWRKFKLPCLDEDSCYPEEHYFPTLLSMEDPDFCTRFTLTRVNWTGSVDGHPHTYLPAEVSPELIRELRRSNSSSPYLFARKFSPDCLQPLLEMAESFIFRD